MLNANGTEGSKPENGCFSADLQTGVRAELEMMLEAPFFAQSARCKSFLSYVVQQTLSGKASELKERTIGISVFGRASDYDTGETSIVRVTANEVRKRIGQYYRESRVAHPIQIELPKGAYVPEFRFRPAAGVNPPEKIDELDSSDEEPAAAKTDSGGPEPPTSVVQSNLTPSRSPQSEEKSSKGPLRSRRMWVAVALLVLLFGVGATFFPIWRNRTQDGMPKVWDAFLRTSVPVLICVDTHDLRAPQAPSSTDGQKFVDMVLRKQIISLDDAAVIASMAGILGKKGIPFRVAGAEQTSLTEFRRQPVILIGAIDNKWTLRLTQSLRYRIEVSNPPGSGSGKEPIASIVDSEHPEKTPWTVDLSIPFVAWKRDYAIVARVDDSTTGMPVLIEAGLGNDGSLAASELFTSDDMLAKLVSGPQCSKTSNFEAVIETEIIETKPGPPRILGVECW